MYMYNVYVYCIHVHVARVKHFKVDLETYQRTPHCDIHYGTEGHKGFGLIHAETALAESGTLVGGPLTRYHELVLCGSQNMEGGKLTPLELRSNPQTTFLLILDKYM